MPRYLLLVSGNEAAEAALTDDDRRSIVDGHIALMRELAAAGTLVVSGALTDSSQTKVLRAGSVTDGPFAETKEAVGGFYLLDCTDADAALAWARRIPPSPGLAVEVRPVREV